MRMWMVNPKIMCRQHLLGEHVELHMLVGAIRRRKSITGFIKKGLLEPTSIIQRHAELVIEMIDRKMKHSSPLLDFDLSYLSEEEQDGYVFRGESLQELIRRCPKCAERYDEIGRN